MASMTPGRCYQITFTNGQSEVFRFLNVNSSGLWDIEVPPDSGTTTFQQRYPGGYKSLDEVACP